MKGTIFLTLLVCLFSVSVAAAQGGLKIIESETRAFYQTDQLQTKLVVENSSQTSAAKITLEILDNDDRVVGRAESTKTLKRGRNSFSIPMFFPRKSDISEILWYRLRATVGSVTAIMSLSEIIPDLFELRVSSTETIVSGTRFPVRVRAVHPTKGSAIENVRVTAKLKLEIESDDKDELEITGTGETDKDGLAVIEFEIPENVRITGYNSGEIEVKGVKNDLESTAEEDLDTIAGRLSIYLNTDKPLYQPNQKLFVRALAFELNTRSPTLGKAAANKELKFSIKDEDELTLYRETVPTSRFGVASLEWQIPDNAKIGTYQIVVENDGDTVGAGRFRVSRYELPNFYVQATPDKPFYLPGEKQAEVAVDAVYLFGKPVAKGKVRVVQESKREWNYAEQKWDVEEEAAYEGETDGDGKYTTKIELTKTHEKLAENEGKQFEDLSFTAYFTDLSTNRTEQRRFDLRVSKEPIHVYLIREDSSYQHPKVPVIFYVSTFSADGQPLACDVDVKGRYEDETEGQRKDLATTKTSIYGAGKIEFELPRRSDDVYYDDLKLKITARDAEDRTGTYSAEIDVDEDEPQIIVQTDKTVYRPNETVEVSVIGSQTDATVFVDLTRNFSTLFSRRLKLKNGRAEVSIPFAPEFRDQLRLTAFFEDEDGDPVSDTTGILYPSPRNLNVGMKTAKDVFRPNEEAALELAVLTPGKTKNEAAVGLLILDKAVEERARTDAEFGGNPDVFGDFRGVLGLAQSFGGLTRKDLEELDLKNPVPPEMQTAAAIMSFQHYSNINSFDSNYAGNLENIFRGKTTKQLAPVKKALEEHFATTDEYPADEIVFRKILRDQGIDFADLRDPWGEEYRVSFATSRDQDQVFIWSNGADKLTDEETRVGERDDFIAATVSFRYFLPTGQKIDQAVRDFYQRTGKYVRDLETLRGVLKAVGIEPDELRDHWGQPYRIEFGVSGRKYTIRFQSGNYDQKFDDYSNDFVIWTTETDYFTATQEKIQNILNEFIAAKKTFPKDETEFKELLKAGGIDFDALHDGWGRPVYLDLNLATRYSDRVEIQSVSKEGEAARESLQITPVTQKVAVFYVRSFGADSEKSDYYYGDVTLSSFAGIISEQARDDAKPKIVVPKTVLTNGRGAIYGVVRDQNDAAVPDAKITISVVGVGGEVETKTNSEGSFLQTALAPGIYSIRAVAEGFKTALIRQVRVEGEKITSANFKLEAGTISEVVFVTDDQSVTIDMSETKIDTMITRQVLETLPKGTSFASLLMLSPGAAVPRTISGGVLNGQFQIDGASGSEHVFVLDGQEVTDIRSGQISLVTKSGEEKKSTPRLREYFPETLLWRPEIITDENGRATLKFRLADNITTWKIYAIASDLDGKVGVAEKEIKAFQPFFVDLVPPRILTKDDEIHLPVQVRNYTKNREVVDVAMAKSDWFSFLTADAQQIGVGAESTANAVFGFKAEVPIKEGKQRVTAVAQNDSDAIEKPVTVNPDGEEIVKTDSRLFSNAETFAIDFPANALPKTQKAEVKVYPNLFSHVSESVEGLLRRPYACGEQTISSTYPNLMILKFKSPPASAKSEPPAVAGGLTLPTKETAIQKRAKTYLQKGYERLLGYQAASGGFTYWGGKDEPDIALTAYAIRFLNDARGFVEVDGSVITRAQNWLISNQQADGSWTRKYYYETVADWRRTKLFTAYVARILAMEKAQSGSEFDQNAEASLQKALAYLKQRNDEIDEPYALALYGLATLDAGNLEDAEAIAERLARIAIPEGSAVYWKLETNTPFYGWGTAGRIETTALVVQALEKVKRKKEKGKSVEEDRLAVRYEDLISKGTLFLLKNKDRYGVWYSTQTTINVLDALLATLAKSEGTAGNSNIQFSLNGAVIENITVSADQIAPIVLDLSDKLNAAENRLEISSSSNEPLMAQTVSTHYIGWPDAEISNRNTNESRQLRLDYNCDRQAAEIMQEITCRVEAERIGFRGYGMLLAEIGTPPGADVSREALEAAMKNDSSLSRYEILPDRIIFYMWSKAGGTNFDFKFKPRYAINAQTPESVVYDYYNPEAQATVVPVRFLVK